MLESPHVCRDAVNLHASTLVMTIGTWSIRAASACGMGLLLLVGACSSPDPVDCPSHPTFRLIVDAQDGHVPGDVQINVLYGSGEELFDARDPDALLKVVFCKLEREARQDGGVEAGDGGVKAGDGGTAEGPISQVVCDLWTDGAATVSVTAQGYPETIRELEAERDNECGLKLTEMRVTLEHEEQP